VPGEAARLWGWLRGSAEGTRKFLTVKLDGRTHALHVRPEDEAKVRAAIGAYARLWNIINELTECELSDLKREARERRRARRRRAS